MASEASDPSPTCHLVALGATTGVGGTAPVSMAAVRAALTRTTRVEYGPGDDDWSHAVRVDTLEPVAPGERVDALLASALEQIRPALSDAGPLRVQAWLAGPARALPIMTRHLRLKAGQVVSAAEHDAAGLLALGAAWRALRERSLDIAVIAAVAVGSDAESLARGRDEERVLGGHSSFGTVPGEAAAALVWMTDEARERLKLPSLGRLLAVADAEEATPFGGKTPCVGEGLVRAIRGALAASPEGGQAARVFCNLNGERERTDEWGFALPRLSQALATPTAFVTPIGAFGEVGAASGLLLIALASALCGRDGPSRAPCLIWTSSRQASRAAAVFEAPEPGWPRPAPAPPWARALDDSILDELADEAGFRYGQRLYQCSGKSDVAPHDLPLALTRIEGALDAAITALVDCGTRAWESVERALEREPTPGALYAAARVAFEARRARRAAQLIEEHVTAAARNTTAARFAITHAAPLNEPAVLGAIVDTWLAAGPRLAALAPWLAAQHGIRPTLDALRAANEGLAEDADDDAVAWLGALDHLAQPDTLPLLRRWRFSRHTRVRRAWANALLRVGGAEGRDDVLARLQEDPAVILPAALCIDAARAPVLRSLACSLSGADPCLALGLLGDRDAIPHLLSCLADPLRADAAALALELLLGAAPSAQAIEADLDPAAPPRAVPTTCHDADAWRELSQPLLATHPAAERLRAGQIAGAASTVLALRRLHLPQRARVYLARELAVRWAPTRPVDVGALLRQREGPLRDIASSPDALALNSWA